MDKLKCVNVRQSLAAAATGILTARERLSRQYIVESDLAEWFTAIRSAVLLIDALATEIENFHSSITFEAVFQLSNDCLEHRMNNGRYKVIAPMTTIIRSILDGESSPYIRTNEAIAALFCIVRKLDWQINQKGK